MWYYHDEREIWGNSNSEKRHHFPQSTCGWRQITKPRTTATSAGKSTNLTTYPQIMDYFLRTYTIEEDTANKKTISPRLLKQLTKSCDSMRRSRWQKHSNEKVSMRKRITIEVSTKRLGESIIQSLRENLKTHTACSLHALNFHAR